MSIGDLVTEVGSAVIHSLADPRAIYFKDADEAGVEPVAIACQNCSGIPQDLKPPLNRNAFLCGCLDFTQTAELEHLIVGFGKKCGSTTKIESLLHFVGEESRVAIPDDLWAAIQQFVLSSASHEVVLFHNHPENVFNRIADNDPLASRADRMALTDLYTNPMLLLKAVAGRGGVRFYVGENGFVREFCTPDILAAVARLKRAFQC